MATLQDVVADYISAERPKLKKELKRYKEQKSLKHVLDFKVLYKNRNNKRESHQRRIPGVLLQQNCDLLVAAQKYLKKTQTFDELHDIVNSLIRPIHGIGVLTVYDTAFRIGAHLGLEPRKVYLHAGTGNGAKRLGIYGKSRDVIEMSEIPKAMKKLYAMECEDFLCCWIKRYKVITQI
jgi:hypothetical protein